MARVLRPDSLRRAHDSLTFVELDKDIASSGARRDHTDMDDLTAPANIDLADEVIARAAIALTAHTVLCAAHAAVRHTEIIHTLGLAGGDTGPEGLARTPHRPGRAVDETAATSDASQRLTLEDIADPVR